MDANDHPSEWMQHKPSHLISAVQFIAHTRQHGGATMNAHTGKLAKIGEPGFVVGGEKDQHGNPVPEAKASAPLGLGETMSAWNRVKALTGHNPNQGFGSWTSRGRVALDASGIYSPEEGKRLTVARDEEGAFDLEKGEDWLNPHYKGKNG